MLSWHHLRFWAHDKRWKMSEFRTAQGNHWPSATWLLQNAAAEGLMLDGAALTPLLDCQWLRSEILCLSFHMLASFPINWHQKPGDDSILCSHGARHWAFEVAVDEKEQHWDGPREPRSLLSCSWPGAVFPVFRTLWEMSKLEISRNPFVLL